VAVVLKAEPDWIGGAQALVSALEAQPDDEGRIQVMDACRAALGDQVYPAFIKLLAAVGRFADAPARRLVAETLARALATARLPATRLPAWGADRFAGLGVGLPQANLRAAGPIEFLCLWLHRDVSTEPLTDEAFASALALVVELLNAAPEAARLYQAKLSGDVESPTEGLHTAASRRSMRALLDAWRAGRAPQDVARATLDAAIADREAGRWSFPAR